MNFLVLTTTPPRHEVGAPLLDQGGESYEFRFCSIDLFNYASVAYFICRDDQGEFAILVFGGQDHSF
jgi:hypothetical protein